MTSDLCQVAFSVVNQMHAMVAYWNADERCVFSNRAYQSWFNKTPEELAGISMQELLGPALYSLNRPRIQGALRGEKQIFEQQLTDASGRILRFLATYTPDAEGNSVRGFSMHVTELPEKPQPREWLPICSSCKDVQTADGKWLPLEEYFSRQSAISFTHGLCPKCLPRFFPARAVAKSA